MNKKLDRALNLLLLHMGTFSLIYLIADSVGCRTDAMMALWLSLLCICVWFAASFHRGILVGMPLAALLLYGAFLYFGAEPASELLDLFDRITGVYYEHIYAPGSSYPFVDSVSSHSLVLLFLGFILASYLSTALTSRSNRVALCILGTMPFFLLCISVNGDPPAPVVMSLLLFWLLLSVSGNSYREELALWKGAIAVLLPATILLSAMTLIFSPERYSYSEKDIARSQRFDQLSRVLSRWLGETGNGLDDALTETIWGATPRPADAPAPSPAVTGWGIVGQSMDMSHGYDFSIHDRLILRARSDMDGRLYLRVNSFGDYAGSSWESAEDSHPLSSLPFTAYAVAQAESGKVHSLSIQPESAMPYLCLPYYGAMAGDEDSHVPAAGSASYQVEFHVSKGDAQTLRLPREYWEEELSYREFAHDYYTRLPQETRTALDALCRREGLDGSDPDIVFQVARYVRDSGEYDLFTTPYPSDDYALYFLTQAHRGYCIHFATAAAALYRSLDIPARVTEGFLLNARSGEIVEVRGADAHAWVEVYRDGLGWLPVEVTGQSATENEGFSPEGAQDENAPSPEPSAAPEMPGDSEDEGPEAPAPEQEGQGKDELPVGILPQDQGGDTGPGAAEDSGGGRGAWWLLPLPVLLIAPLWYYFARLRYLRSTRQADRRRAAVAVYGYAHWLSRFGADMPEPIQTCAERASFSQHAISDAELERCQALLEEELRSLYLGLKPLQKLQVRFYKGLL